MQKESVEFILLSGGDDEVKQTNVALFHTQKKLDFQKLPHPIRMTSIEDELSENQPIKPINPLKKRNKWRICDGEGKNNFEGVLEAGQTANYIILTKDGPYFRVTPIKDWYKFRPFIPRKNDENEENDLESIINKDDDKRKDKLSVLLGKKKDEEEISKVSELSIYGELDDEEGDDQDIELDKEYAEALDFDDDNADEEDVYEIKDIEKKYSKTGKELNKILKKHGFDVDDDVEEEDEEIEDEELKKKASTTTTTTTITTASTKEQKQSTKKRKSPDTSEKDEEKLKKQKLIDQSEEFKKLENEIFDITRRQIQVRNSIPGRELLVILKSHFGNQIDDKIKLAIKSVISKRLSKNERDEFVLKNNTYP